MKKIAGLSSILVFGLTIPAEAGTKAPRVRLETSRGNIVLELDRAKAPKTVENFLALVES